MQRGCVWLARDLLLPNPNTGVLEPHHKFAVVLNTAAPNPDGYVVFLLASTDRMAGEPRPFEVRVQPNPPNGFQDVTKIDCRWPFTMQQQDLHEFLFRLPQDVMHLVDEALKVGLEMNP